MQHINQRVQLTARIVLFGLWLLPWYHAQSTADPATAQPTFSPHMFLFSAGLSLSDDEKLSHGFRLRGQYFHRPVERLGLGVSGSWSTHGTAQFARVAIGIQFLLDDLPVLPSFQTSLGGQVRFDAEGFALTADLHFGVSLEVPLSSRWRLGAAFHGFLTLDTGRFPISKSFHLRSTLVF